MAARGQQGISLLEMLVVLMIAGMALALGFQSLGQWRRADAAISALSGRMQEALLTQRWLQESLGSLTPVEDVPFEGSASALSGITLNPVLATQGGATEVAWRLEPRSDGMRLVLEEAGRVLELPLLERVESAQFVYLDPDGRAHGQWPPAIGSSDALPASILLQIDGPSGPDRIWGAAVLGIRNPVQVPYDFEEF